MLLDRTWEGKLMDLKDIVIIVLAIVLVLMIGFLLGQRKGNTYTSGTSEPSSNGIAAADTTKKVDAFPATPSPRDYSKQIAQVKVFHQRAGNVYSAMAENLVLAPFNDAYAQISDAYSRYGLDKKEHTKEESLMLFASLFSAAKFSDSQKEISNAAGEIAESIIKYYDDQVSTIFCGKPFETLSSRYRLSADLRASQLAKISAIVTSHFSAVIPETRDIEQRNNRGQTPINLQTLQIQELSAHISIGFEP